MNYYQRHLGDFARDTAHLSALEFGVYNLLLDWYYANERPIPDAQAHRYGRCERETVAMILSEFFTKDGDHWSHKRVEAEIAAYNAKAAKNREVGKMGGRPKANANHDGYQSVSERLANGSKNVTESNPSHKPLAISQEREKTQEAETHVSDPSGKTSPTETEKPRRKRNEKLTIRAWVRSLPEDEDPIEDSDPIFEWARLQGVPPEWVRYTFEAFFVKYTEGPDGKKLQSDWRAHFRNAVRGDWFKVWRIGNAGVPTLSTVGEQWQRCYNQRAAESV